MQDKSKTPTYSPVPSWDRFKAVRFCRKGGITFLEVIKGRIAIAENRNRGIGAERRGKEKK
ncbi:MAG: hypothetical protein GTO08_01645 [Deltaproteobacteria bacterium]|nr:hypothetical protein [Deltaproteobacteria bacterium]